MAHALQLKVGGHVWSWAALGPLHNQLEPISSPVSGRWVECHGGNKANLSKWGMSYLNTVPAAILGTQPGGSPAPHTSRQVAPLELGGTLIHLSWPPSPHLADARVCISEALPSCATQATPMDPRQAPELALEHHHHTQQAQEPKRMPQLPQPHCFSEVPDRAPCSAPPWALLSVQSSSPIDPVDLHDYQPFYC